MSNDNLNVDLDLTKTSPDELDGLPAVLPIGTFHILVHGAQRHADDNKFSLRLSYTVLAGTEPSAVGQTSRENFSLSDAARWRLNILASRIGLVTKEDCGQRKSGVNFATIIGRELIVEIIHEEYAGKDGKERTSSKWGSAGFWDVDDERVVAIPKDRPAATALRQKVFGRQQPVNAAATATPRVNYPPVQQTMAGTPAGAAQNGKPSVVGYI